MASIRKTQSGKWSARVSIKGKAQSIGTFPTKKEAEIASAKFEADVKPQFSIPDLKTELESDLKKWKEHLASYELIHNKTLNSDYSLEIETIQNFIAIIEKSLRTFVNRKRNDTIGKLPSINIF
jgi:hypothetical protein